ncbi:hypothetical protein BP6252_10758 [Coleophoma cylindrospora]|uniref:DUF6536 domain-containing protein n=1 Tax=Coleophoma cylindrospora TaxID=1849047 RepID=A0A3D8QTK2_9HELO|nr:hypothetical protein BP6252_10758 [Coleophoma cylindrospora]
MTGRPPPTWIALQPAMPPPDYAFSQNTAYKSGPSNTYVQVSRDESGAVPPQSSQTFLQRWFGGTKRALRAFAVGACVILILNVTWMCAAKAKYGIKDGFGTIREDNCAAAKSLNTWLHFAINIASTLLLTGSNAFMAVFCCPSRKEVDEAHRRGKTLHVGVFNLGNLRRIAKRKGLVVILLASSSVPFHLLYNSLVFTSLATNQYYWSVVTEDFLAGAPFNLTGDWVIPAMGYPHVPAYPTFTASPPSSEFGNLYRLDESGFARLDQVMTDYFVDMQHSAPSWERLENKDCLQAYSNAFVSDRRNVVLVSSAKNANNSILQYGSADFQADMDGNWWICSKHNQDGGFQTCNAQDYISSADTWTVFDYPIEYCLSQLTDDVCSVQFSMTIMVTVIAFNALKVVLMVSLLLFYDAEKILTSVGDAAQSFLTNQDQTTQMMCLANKREINHFWTSRGLARPFNPHRMRWGASVSKKRWLLFFFLMTVSLCFVAIFGIWGFSHVRQQGVNLNLPSLWNLGFGELNQNTLVVYGGGGNAVTMTIIANIPQLFLSVISILYMGIVTTMFLAVDWSHFAFKAQALMVSTPSGKQRGTWLLGAPLGWGIALLSFLTLLHWFISQSIFIVQLTVYDKDGKPYAFNPGINYQTQYTQFSNCGYSPIAIIFSVIAAVILLLSAIILCWQRFPAGAPPIVGTCSAAISAACHPIETNTNIVQGDLRWGAYGGLYNEVGHCALVSAEVWDIGRVRPPVPGQIYAGLPSSQPYQTLAPVQQ